MNYIAEIFCGESFVISHVLTLFGITDSQIFDISLSAWEKQGEWTARAVILLSLFFFILFLHTLYNTGEHLL